MDNQIFSFGIVEERYEKLTQTQTWPPIEAIIGVSHCQNDERGYELEDWKHCLVKWAGQEYLESTWELTSYLAKIYPEAAIAFKEYIKQRRVEFCATHDP